MRDHLYMLSTKCEFGQPRASGRARGRARSRARGRARTRNSSGLRIAHSSMGLSKFTP